MVKVVLAIDDSEHSLRAWEFYLESMHRADNTLVLVHAIEIPYQPVQPLRAEILQDILQQCKDEAAQVEAKFKRLVEEKGVRYEVVSEFGRPGEVICSHAKDGHADMIILGTRGMGKVRRTILGSVSDHVVHHAHCPVMICRK